VGVPRRYGMVAVAAGNVVSLARGFEPPAGAVNDGALRRVLAALEHR
jgi:hypothetical protein